MRNRLILSVALLFTLSILSSEAQVQQKDGKSSNVNVYYFHFTRRCTTCMAVEENAKKAVELLYPEKVKTGEYTFTAINLDEAAGKNLADKLKVGGQTLLVVRGDKKIDITDKGFLNAHDLVKMKEEIKSAIDKVLF
jgi:hypothetical protein